MDQPPSSEAEPITPTAPQDKASVTIEDCPLGDDECRINSAKREATPVDPFSGETCSLATPELPSAMKPKRPPRVGFSDPNNNPLNNYRSEKGIVPNYGPPGGHHDDALHNYVHPASAAASHDGTSFVAAPAFPAGKPTREELKQRLKQRVSGYSASRKQGYMNVKNAMETSNVKRGDMAKIAQSARKTGGITKDVYDRLGLNLDANMMADIETRIKDGSIMNDENYLMNLANAFETGDKKSKVSKALASKVNRSIGTAANPATAAADTRFCAIAAPGEASSEAHAGIDERSRNNDADGDGNHVVDDATSENTNAVDGNNDNGSTAVTTKHRDTNKNNSSNNNNNNNNNSHNKKKGKKKKHR